MGRVQNIRILGFDLEVWKNKTEQIVEISIHDLYSGYGDSDVLSRFTKLMNFLVLNGVESRGMDLIKGYYDSIDDVRLTVLKKIKSNQLTIFNEDMLV